MADEKRNIQGYEELYAVRLAGGEVILAVNNDAAEPYMVCDCRNDNLFRADMFDNGEVSADYLEIMREFTKRLADRTDAVAAERMERGIPFATLTAADCEPKGVDSDLDGRVIVIKVSSFAPEYRSIDSQLALCTGGFGAKPDAIGRAVYCTELYSGKAARWDRSDIAGVLPADRLPDWAHNKFVALQKPAEKESVLEQIKQAKQNKEPPNHPKTKKHDKGRPER